MLLLSSFLAIKLTFRFEQCAVDGHIIQKEQSNRAQLPILRAFSKQVRVTALRVRFSTDIHVQFYQKKGSFIGESMIVSSTDEEFTAYANKNMDWEPSAPSSTTMSSSSSTTTTTTTEVVLPHTFTSKRAKSYKKGIDSVEKRRNREDMLRQMREKKKRDQLYKIRRMKSTSIVFTSVELTSSKIVVENNQTNEESLVLTMNSPNERTTAISIVTNEEERDRMLQVDIVGGVYQGKKATVLGTTDNMVKVLVDGIERRIRKWNISQDATILMTNREARSTTTSTKLRRSPRIMRAYPRRSPRLAQLHVPISIG